MRTKLLLLATIALILQGDQRGRAQGSVVNPYQNNGIFWAPNTGRRVTISQRGNPVVVLSFPAGVFLDASFTEMKPITNAGQWVFTGNVRLRAQPAASALGNPPGRFL